MSGDNDDNQRDALAELNEHNERLRRAIEAGRHVSRTRGESGGEEHSEIPNVLRDIVPRIDSIWIWEPMRDNARATLKVTDVKWNGEEAWVETQNLDKPAAERCWNELAHWVQATVLVAVPDES